MKDGRFDTRFDSLQRRVNLYVGRRFEPAEPATVLQCLRVATVVAWKDVENKRDKLSEEAFA